MNPSRSPLQPIPSWKWGIIWLLFLGTMINYMDRQTMQVTSSHLIREFFDGKERGYGQVESAFQYAFAGGMVIAGFLVDRFNVRWFYAGALFVWSVAGLPRILKKDLSYTEQDMLWMLVGFFVAADLGCMLAGYVTRRLTHSGFSVERSRKLVSFGTSLLCLLAIPLALKPAAWLAVPLVLLVAAGAMGGFANMFALAQETAPRHTAKVVGIASCAPWLALAWLNPIIGGLADRSGTFAPTVMCIAFVPLCGSVFGWFWPEKPTMSR